MDAHVEVFFIGKLCTSTNRLGKILDKNHEKAKFNKVTQVQYQTLMKKMERYD